MKTVLIYLVGLVAMAFSCSPPQNWKTKTMLERILSSDVLVYGEVSDITEQTDAPHKTIEYRIDVFCVLRSHGKSRETIGRHVTVLENDPPGECVSNRHAMDLGKSVILMLTDHYTEEGKFKFQNINVQSAVFEGNEENANTIAKTCKFSEMFAPSWEMETPKCPVQAETEACNTAVAGRAASYYPGMLLALFLVSLLALYKLL